jgi:predicted ArsR family transcriptional regulator
MASPDLAAAAAGYSVSRVIETLQVLVEGSVTAAELASALLICTRTARRMLQRLEWEGYVEAHERSPIRYEASKELRELGRRLGELEPEFFESERSPTGSGFTFA